MIKKSDKIVYRQKTLAQLSSELESLRRQLNEYHVKQGSGQLKDTSVFKKTRYKIALIQTLISQKQHEKIKQSNQKQK